MNRGVYMLGATAFVLSAFFLPSTVTVLVAVLLIGLWRSYLLVLAVGVLVDVSLGLSVASLGGFAYVYTALFAFLALLSIVLERALIE